MFASVSLRFREQDLITQVMSEFLDSGWSYQGFIPGPEYTTKSQNASFAVGNQAFALGNIEKDKWFLLTFTSQTATDIPAGLRNIRISGKKDAFFKANRPAFLSGRINTFPKKNDLRESLDETLETSSANGNKPAATEKEARIGIFMSVAIISAVAIGVGVVAMIFLTTLS